MSIHRGDPGFITDVDALRAPTRALILTDCRKGLAHLPGDSVSLTHTSPPYNIGRNYRGFRDQHQLDEYSALVSEVFRELHRVTAPGGSVFWQVGYTSNGESSELGSSGITALDCFSIPLAIDAGFVLWDRVVWSYFGSMAFQTKFTNRYETILWLTKLDKSGSTPFFDLDQIREKSKSYDGRNHVLGRNPGNVWESERVAFGSLGQTSHVAVFPEEVSEKIVRACSRVDDLICDPFAGSGTLPKVALTLGRRFVGTEISSSYIEEADQRLRLWAPSEVGNLAFGLLVKHGFANEPSKQSKSKLAQSLGNRRQTDTAIRRRLRELQAEVKEVREAERVTRSIKDRKEQLWAKYDAILAAGDVEDDIIAADSSLCFCFAHRRRWNGVRRYMSAAETLLRLRTEIEGSPSVESYLTDLCVQADTRFAVLGRSIECLRVDPGLGCNGGKQPARKKRAPAQDGLELWG